MTRWQLGGQCAPWRNCGLGSSSEPLLFSQLHCHSPRWESSILHSRLFYIDPNACLTSTLNLLDTRFFHFGKDFWIFPNRFRSQIFPPNRGELGALQGIAHPSCHAAIESVRNQSHSKPTQARPASKNMSLPAVAFSAMTGNHFGTWLP